MRTSVTIPAIALGLAVGAIMAAAQMMGTLLWSHWGRMGPWHMGSGPMGATTRNHVAMMSGIPEPYRSMTNSMPRTQATMQHGAAVYEQNCAACHGVTGRGDGANARDLSPRPADLAWLSRMRMAQWDPFMYWTVAEGGAPLGTAMPAFKDVLSKDDIWSVVAYIQAQLPQVPGNK